MSKRRLELYVEQDNDEKVIVINNYTYEPGYPAKISGAPEDCYPAEGPTIEDVEAEWQGTGKKLTNDEYNIYLEQIEELIFNAAVEDLEYTKEDRDD